MRGLRQRCVRLFAGVRTRSALAAAVVMALCLAVAGGILLLVLYRSLESTAQTAAGLRAERIAVALRADDLDDLDSTLLATDGQIGAVQIIGAAGLIRAASNGAPRSPLAAVSVASGQAHYLGRVKTAAGAEYWVSARGATADGEPVTILVAVNREPVESIVTKVGVLLAVGAPVLIGLVAVATYRLTGAALTPVEAIRARVASISSTDLSQRVPVPATGDEIAQLAATMNAMLARLERGRAAQLRLVGDVSHELRSPLATISTALELAAGRPDLLDADLIDGSLLPEARRMNRLIEDLLLLARSDEGVLGLRREDVDVDDLLLAEVTRLTSLGPVHPVACIQPCRTVGDRAALARVIRNLVDNAARHAAGTVTLDCHPEPGRVVISVADDGPGIPAADRERVFERFVRLDAARTRAAGGSGLGLAIVDGVVRSHGGTVTVGDGPDGGAVFTVVLPQADSAGDDQGSVSETSR
ncbi:HAMP domain-containing protein [Mycobacterium sp. M1]|uniref:histidine kinase n=1 Tax=Mycolicibacter acidiphilus TaxID=2835306 RepID=A0ABS5RI87_9MYCO|nr:ATP-binding protein [Mycolicibacter acidiphilus]MBS9534018.1 HAMP domain-containing protein [Mycolicibacter acidiphilus]